MKGTIKDFAVGIPIGIMYNIFFNKVTESMLKDYPYNERFEKTIIYLLVISVITFIVAQKIFYENNGIMYVSLVCGSLLLLFNSIVVNWEKISDDAKLLIFGIILGASLWFAFYVSYDVEKNNDNKKPVVKKLKQKNKVELDLDNLDELL
jgi:hypothetical protein